MSGKALDLLGRTSRGALLGGDEGRRMRDEATAAVLANAAVNPDRMTDLLAPGSAPP